MSKKLGAWPEGDEKENNDYKTTSKTSKKGAEKVI